MKKFFFILPCLFCAMLFSCQKELPEQIFKPNDADSSNGLLYKTVSTYLTDKLDWYTAEYEYDISNRIILQTNTIKTKEPNGTITVNKGTNQFFRDSLGRIVRTGSLPDTSSINIIANYENAISNKIVSNTILLNTLVGITLLDSMAFSYDAENQIVKSSSYAKLTPSGQLLLNGYTLYQYDNRGNMIERQQFIRNANNSFELNIIFRFDYDDGINPLYHPELAWVYWDIGWPVFLSPNNVVKQINDYPDPTSFDNNISYSYAYNNQRRPVSQSTVGDTANIIKFYYK